MMDEFNQEEENEQPLEEHEKDADKVDDVMIHRIGRDRDRGVSWTTR